MKNLIRYVETARKQSACTRDILKSKDKYRVAELMLAYRDYEETLGQIAEQMTPQEREVYDDFAQIANLYGHALSCINFLKSKLHAQGYLSPEDLESAFGQFDSFLEKFTPKDNDDSGEQW